MAIERFEIDTEQWAVVSKGALQMVVNALRRDAEEGRAVRGEMADELLAAAPRPEAVLQSTPLSDAELVDIIYRAGLGHTSDLLYEKIKDGIEVDYPTVEARKLAAFLMRQTTPRPAPKCLTCNDHGMIGGPSYYQPDEGGVPCPDCKGSGKRDYEYGSSDAGWVSGERPCDDCDGTGLVRPAEVKQ